jgi:hypothetical protein
MSDERELRNPSKVKPKMLRSSREIPARNVLAACVIVAIASVFGATNPVVLPDIAGQKCILTAEIADTATKRLAILLEL